MADCDSLCACLGKAFYRNTCPEINKILTVQRFVVNYWSKTNRSKCYFSEVISNSGKDGGSGGSSQ